MCMYVCVGECYCMCLPVSGNVYVCVCVCLAGSASACAERMRSCIGVHRSVHDCVLCVCFGVYMSV